MDGSEDDCFLLGVCLSSRGQLRVWGGEVFWLLVFQSLTRRKSHVWASVKSDSLSSTKKNTTTTKKLSLKKNLGIGGRLKVSMRNIEKLKRDEKRGENLNL